MICQIVSAPQKRCSKCEQIKDFNAFYVANGRKDGRSVWCKTCSSQWAKDYREVRRIWESKWREFHREEQRLRARKYRLMYPEKVEASRAKAKISAKTYPRKHNEHSRAIKRNIKRRRRATKRHVQENFGIAESRFVRNFWNNKCAICGRTQEEEMLGIGRSLAIDHWLALDNGNPLTMLNAVLLCAACNGRKGKHEPKDILDTTIIERIETGMREQDVAWQSNVKLVA